MVRELIGKVFRLQDYSEQKQSFRTIHIEQIGSTGTESYSGYPREEYLATLQGVERARVFDKMRRSDAQVSMLLNASKAPLLSAIWDVEPGDQDDEESKKDAELIKHILFQDMDKGWSEFLNEALTCIDFGHSVFEVIDKVSSNPDFGTFNSIGTLAFRSQKTIERWNLDHRTDKLLSISQYAYGDLDRLVDIPAEFLLVFTMKKEGSNYEGISSLRPCYGNYFRKNIYLKLNGIGIEKFAVPTPLVKVPAGRESGDQYDNMVAALERYLTHEKNYLTYPDGWEIDLKSNTYDPELVEIAIDNEDKRMAKAFVLNFLELGMNGFGSQSLSFDLSDFFLGTLDQVAQVIEDQFNRMLIPRLIELNRGKRAKYPKLKHSGITDKGSKELAESLSALVSGKIIQPDDVLESRMRKMFSLPEASEEGRREAAPAPQPFQQGKQDVPALMERIQKMRQMSGKK